MLYSRTVNGFVLTSEESPFTVKGAANLRKRPTSSRPGPNAGASSSHIRRLDSSPSVVVPVQFSQAPSPDPAASALGAKLDSGFCTSAIAPNTAAVPEELTNNPRFNRWMMRNRTGATAGTTIALSVLVSLSTSQNQQ